jgi:excisionase family DNA binding protein
MGLGVSVSEPAHRLLTVTEVAQVTGLSPNAVYRAISAGELQAAKLRGRLRVPASALDEWIDLNLVSVPRSRRQTPPAPARTGRVNRPGRGLRELLDTT